MGGNRAAGPGNIDVTGARKRFYQVVYKIDPLLGNAGVGDENALQS